MATYLVRIASSSLALVCTGCVAAPQPAWVAVTLPPNCQQFTQTILVDGKSQPGYGIECQQPDGTWKVTAPAAATPPPMPPSYVYVVPGYVWRGGWRKDWRPGGRAAKSYWYQ